MNWSFLFFNFKKSLIELNTMFQFVLLSRKLKPFFLRMKLMTNFVDCLDNLSQLFVFFCDHLFPVSLGLKFLDEIVHFCFIFIKFGIHCMIKSFILTFQQIVFCLNFLHQTSFFFKILKISFERLYFLLLRFYSFFELLLKITIVFLFGELFIIKCLILMSKKLIFGNCILKLINKF